MKNIPYTGILAGLLVVGLVTGANATRIDFSNYPNGSVPQNWTPQEASYVHFVWPDTSYYSLGGPFIRDGWLILPDDQGFGIPIYFDFEVTDIVINFNALSDSPSDPVTVFLNEASVLVEHVDPPISQIISSIPTQYAYFWYSANWSGNEMERISSIEFTPTSVPEPATALLFTTGALGWAARRRWRTRKG